MKKFILTIAVLLCFVIITKAQLTPGQKTIDGNINFSYQGVHDSAMDGNNYNADFLHTTLSFGKFISTTRESGFFVSYDLIAENYKPNPQKYNSNQIGIGYFSTYYKPIGKNFYLTLGWNGGGSYIFGTTSGDTVSLFNSNVKGFEINAGLFPGVTYKWNKHWLIDLDLMSLVQVSYSHTENKYSEGTGTPAINGDVKSSDFGISSSLSNAVNNLAFGFRYLF